MYYQLTQNSLTQIKLYQKESDFGGSSSFIYRDGKLIRKEPKNTAIHNRGYKQYRGEETTVIGRPCTAHSQSVVSNGNKNSVQMKINLLLQN